MKMFSAFLALCVENPTVTVDSPHKEPVMWSFDIFDVEGLDKLFNK